MHYEMYVSDDSNLKLKIEAQEPAENAVIVQIAKKVKQPVKTYGFLSFRGFLSVWITIPMRAKASSFLEFDNS